MPTQDWGVYPDSLTVGTEVSSTYEGRHITATAAELNHGDVLGVVTKGYPVIFGIAGTPYGVGVAFNTEVAGGDLIAVDTEGIWNLSVVGSDDNGNSLVRAGELLYINTTTAVISKISNIATQIPFGYALGQANGDGAAHTIAVKVHFDPGTPAEFFGARIFNDAVIMDSTLNVAGLTTLAALTATGVIQLQNTTIITGALMLGAGVNVTGAAILNSGLSVAGQVDLQTVFIHSQMFMAGILHLPDNVDAAILPAADPGGVNRLWVNAGIVTRN